MAWKLQRGENALFEGTVLLATSAGATPVPTDITGGTLVLHFGSFIDTPIKTWTSGGSSLQILAGTVGVWRFEFQPVDTEGILAGPYLYDLWYRTAAGKEYALTLATVTILPVIGTI